MSIWLHQPQPVDRPPLIPLQEHCVCGIINHYPATCRQVPWDFENSTVTSTAEGVDLHVTTGRPWPSHHPQHPRTCCPTCTHSQSHHLITFTCHPHSCHMWNLLVDTIHHSHTHHKHSPHHTNHHHHHHFLNELVYKCHHHITSHTTHSPFTSGRSCSTRPISNWFLCYCFSMRF